jgi:hypothetical protein
VPVTLSIWRVPPVAVPLAMLAVAVNRARLRRTPGVKFAKVLGTGRGSRFGPTSADLSRWAALIVSEADGDDDGRSPKLSRGPTTATCTITLSPIASRGTWSKQTPFQGERNAKGNVLVLTRARLRASRLPVFWRANRPVARTLPGQEGLLAAFGFGEAPFGYQGTVSIWRNTADVTRFAYRQPEHAAVVARTPLQRWYAEELFARFHVLDIEGDREVIGWTEAP